jgi:hypothetical protein
MNHTPGTWREGKSCAAIVSLHPEALGKFLGETTGEERRMRLDTIEFYGGFPICESVSSWDRPLIMAAPALLEAAYELRDLMLNYPNQFKIQAKDLAIDLRASLMIEKFQKAIEIAEGKESNVPKT